MFLGLCGPSSLSSNSLANRELFPYFFFLFTFVNVFKQSATDSLLAVVFKKCVPLYLFNFFLYLICLWLLIQVLSPLQYTSVLLLTCLQISSTLAPFTSMFLGLSGLCFSFLIFLNSYPNFFSCRIYLSFLAFMHFLFLAFPLSRLSARLFFNLLSNSSWITTYQVLNPSLHSIN